MAAAKQPLLANAGLPLYCPGPWRVSINAVTDQILTIECDAISGVGRWRIGTVVASNRPVGKANANLIAAAPDMLAACRAAMAYDAAIQVCGATPEQMSSFCTAQGDGLDDLYLDWITKARAALAKAEPRS